MWLGMWWILEGLTSIRLSLALSFFSVSTHMACSSSRGSFAIAAGTLVAGLTDVFDGEGPTEDPGGVGPAMAPGSIGSGSRTKISLATQPSCGHNLHCSQKWHGFGCNV